MGKEAKRERQKSNREAARIEREKMVRRSKQKRQAILLIGLLVAVFAVIFLIQLSKDDDKKASSTTTTTAPKRDYTAPPPMAIDPNKTYTAKIETNFGTIEMALDAKQAPKGVNNFVFLARNNFYNGLDFHRAVQDFVIQGGDPKGDGTGGPGYSEVGEAPPGGTYATASVAYAKGGAEPDFTFGSQFFITTGSPDALNASPGYAYLGNVTKGLDNARKIEALAPDPATQAGTPTKKATITKITIFENGTALKPTPAASTTSTGPTTTGTTTTIGASVSVGIPTTKP